MDRTLKKVCFHMFSDQPERIKEIAKTFGKDYAVWLRGILDLVLEQHERVIYLQKEITDLEEQVALNKKLLAEQNLILSQNKESIEIIQNNRTILHQQEQTIQNHKAVITILQSKKVTDSEGPKEQFRHCQKCGTKVAIRKLHLIGVGTEEFVFGDCCFYNNSYKEILRQLI